MSRLLATAIMLVLFVAYPSWGTMDIGNSAVTRLWSSEGFVCSGAYIREYQEGGAWVLSAGHCARPAKYAKRAGSDFISGWIDWRVAAVNYMPADAATDIAIGTLPDPRIGPRQWYSHLADKSPSEGVVYVHGFPAGIEKVVRGEIIGKPKEYPNAKYMWEISTPNVGDLTSGVSGAPVLSEDGIIVGVLWAVRADPFTGTQTNRAIYTDIAALHALINSLGIKLE